MSASVRRLNKALARAGLAGYSVVPGGRHHSLVTAAGQPIASVASSPRDADVQVMKVVGDARRHQRMNERTAA